MRIVIANSNPVHEALEKICQQRHDAVVIHDKSELTVSNMEEKNPDYIFFFHWSHLIPKEIYERFLCIVFHMTDLPYGRGGSPLQNLIVKGHTETMLSAIKVEAGIDTGPVFLKKPLSLGGTAEEIFLRAGKVMSEMMDQIVTQRLQAVPQKGEPVLFKRRTPADGNIISLDNLQTVYDYIRMLDSVNYPKAYIETDFLKLEFSRASLRADGLHADVKITIKKKE